MDTDALLDVARKMRASRLKEQYTPIVGSRTSDLVQASSKMRSQRQANMEPPKPLPVQRFAHMPKAFVCKDLFGIEISVKPSLHSLEQFVRRYGYVDHYCNWNYDAPNFRYIVEDKMRAVFNSGKQRTNMSYIDRNSEYANNKHIIAWGTDTMNFIVDTHAMYIITSELCGELRRYN
ncbi:MAG: hypothetical protein WC358_09660 [Ignavibacteria bacterium]|jgi:hypothetical protein